jgi:serine/threonine protein kinase
LGGALETTLQPPPTEAFAPAGPAEDLAFDSFGPYTILRVLGEGGMGAVYLAEQFQPIQRKVALKVIKPGLDSRSILNRFNYERQTLALMDHPNIARVFDASATAKGRPYFVMEYIEGEPITAYCDRHRLNTRQRLELFIHVCLAVQHAHSKGILHRDIKPSNVLVTEIDGAPVPKVIDFGIAKATDQQNYEQTAFTQFGQFVGTPEYMSPEAADLVGGGVDTTSDVYSLGVLLYELLVGAVPFDGKALRKAGMSELLRVLREVEAPSLPAKLTSFGQTLADIAARRASTPIGLRKEVGGELNLITLKAVEKDRTQRYDSARALSEDIQRFLESRPVKACPPTLQYRLRKYGAKHRGAVAAAAALLLAVAGGAGATLWQARNAIRERAVAVAQRKEAEAQRAEAVAQRADAVTQRTQAVEQRARAESEAARASEQEKRAAAGAQDIRSLANTMLFQLDDQLKDTGSIAARTTLLNLGLEYLRKAGASDPNLGAAYFRVAELQESLRDTDQAAANYRQSARLLAQRLARDPRDGESRRLAACVKLGLANFDGSLEGRLAGLKEAETALRSLISDEPRNGRAMLDLSRVLAGEAKSWASVLFLFNGIDRDPQEAVTWAERAVQAGEAKPSDMVVLAEAQMRVSDWIVDQPQAKEGIAWCQRAVATLEAASRQEPANTRVLAALSAAYANLATHHGNRDEQEKAVAAGNRAVETARQAVAIDPENPANRVQLANSQGALARSSSGTGTLQQLRADSGEVTRIYRELIAHRPGLLQYRIDLAAWLLQQAIPELNSANFREAAGRAEQAAAELRSVVQQRPSDRFARRALSLALVIGGVAHSSLREFPQGQPLFDESLASARALMDRSAGIADAAMAAESEALMSFGLSAMGQPVAALDHAKAASAMVHRWRDAARTDRFVLIQWSTTQNTLANACLAHRDDACLRDALEELRPILDAKYAENPYDSMVTLALWQRLFHQRTLYNRNGQTAELLATSRRNVEIMKKLAAALPGNAFREARLQNAMFDLSFDLRQAGLRDESLAANREAAATFAAGLAAPPSRTEMRLDLVNTAGYVARYFNNLHEAAEGLRLGLQIIPFVEAIVQKDPQNQRAADELQTTLYDAASNALNAGDLAQARDLLVRDVAVRSRRAPRTSAEFYALAQRQVRIANLEERLANTAAAARQRDTALETLKASFSISERALAESKGQSVAELNNMQAVRQLLAMVFEQHGQIEAARQSAEESAGFADRLAAVQNTAANREIQRSARGRLFRLLELAGAPGAEFQKRSGSAAPLTAEQKTAFIAEGWRLAVVDMGNYPYDPGKRVPAAQRAVDGYRSLLRDGGTVPQRIDLALALYQLAFAHQAVALWSNSTAERVAGLESSVRFAREELTLLEALRAAGTLPEVNRANWSTVKILLPWVESKLAAERATTTAEQK